MGFLASVDGVIAPAKEARVSVLDNGFTFGDSVYETLRTYGRRPFHLDRHLLRLRRSADRLGIEIPLDDQVFAERLSRLLEAAQNEESYIRIIVTRGVGDVSYHFERVHGPTVVLVVKPYEPFPDDMYDEGAAVIVASVRRNHPRALDPAIKSCNLLNNILAVREAQSQGAMEAILLNERGEVAEGASTNVFVVKSGQVKTPPLDAGILPGVTRQLLLELGPTVGVPIREEVVSVSDLAHADEAFLTSTLKEVAPIRSIDGNPVGAGRPGPLTLRLLAAYREYARQDTA